jgi:hypothetical protein
LKKSILPYGKNPSPRFSTGMYPEKLYIDITKKSPWIVLEEGRIFIMGRSIIENPGRFFDPIYSWIAAYAKNWKGRTRIELGFEYINTGSIKWLYLIIRELAEMCNMPENIAITWYYEKGDEDMKELGHIIKSLLECSFSIVRVNNMDEDLYISLLSKPV